MNAPSISLVAALATVSLHAATYFFTVDMNGSNEVPPNGTSGTGSAVVAYESSSGVLAWNITFSGLSGTPSGMHFHGPATTGVNAGVQVNVGSISGLSSPSAGRTTISGAQGTDLLAGLYYLNLHTDVEPGGEIRGQVMPVIDMANVMLDAQQEVPPNPSTGTGAALVEFDPFSNGLSWFIDYSGLTGTPILMHFHGPAPTGVNAGVQVDIAAISGLIPPMQGSTTISGSQADQLTNGLWYINVHSDVVPGGEIRGQVYIIPEGALLLAGGLALVLALRR
jgi:hypothetical protein